MTINTYVLIYIAVFYLFCNDFQQAIIFYFILLAAATLVYRSSEIRIKQPKPTLRYE